MIRCFPGAFESFFSMAARLGSPWQDHSNGSQIWRRTEKPTSVARRQTMAQESARPRGRPPRRMVRRWRMAWTSSRKITHVSGAAECGKDQIDVRNAAVPRIKIKSGKRILRSRKANGDPGKSSRAHHQQQVLALPV